MKKLLLATLLVSGSAFAQDACKVTVEGNDAMQFNVNEIKFNKAACPEFTVELKHTGNLPAAAMGHNVVISKTTDTDAVAGDGAAAADNHYVKADDARVLAFTKLIGGGETTEVKFKTDAFEVGGDYTFFCSFPGHYAIMRGKVVVE